MQTTGKHASCCSLVVTIMCLQAQQAAAQVLDVWVSHASRDRVIVPNLDNNVFGSSYHLRETECQAAQLSVPTLVDSMRSWRQRKLWASVSACLTL